MTRTSAPTVAVVIGRDPITRYSVHSGYVEALWELGAKVAVLPAGPGADIDGVVELVRSSGALLLTGGADVDPSMYGAEPTGLEKGCDLDRDRTEVAAVHAALDAGKRVLGICRGMQLLAVALGGTLVADLPTAGFHGHDNGEREDERVHEVKVEARSQAETVLAGQSKVNSLHHQAVADPGPQVRVSAWAADGVVEAIEAGRALGIQWHPERFLPGDTGRLEPFRWLVAQ